jgi:FkbH-like protein
MIHSDKLEKRIGYESRLQNNYQEIDNSYLWVFINHFVKKFRQYDNDEFLIVIQGLNSFVSKDEKKLTYLFEQLQAYNFTINYYGDVKTLNHIDITCKNITKDTSYNFEYQIQNIVNILELSSKTDIPTAGIITMKIVAMVISKIKILYKAIVLDLDDTLWKGTLSEVGKVKIKENLQSEQGVPFIAFMKFIKTMANELGLFIAICSRNDSKIVESTIDELDDNIFPLKNQFDYIIANNNDKSENICKIAEQLSILPKAIVFIDDNQIVRDEIKNKLPEVYVPEWTNHTELITQFIVGCIFERVELSLSSQNRRKQYKIIQTERFQNSLPALNVKINNDDKHTESIKLYSKSNQFKFSPNDDTFDEDAKSIFLEIYRENGENLGICSALTYTLKNDTFYIHNWAISCRYFKIGLEEIILMFIQKKSNANKFFINYQRSEYNQIINELIHKYTDAFKKYERNNALEIVFTEEIINKINRNTNLKII